MADAGPTLLDFGWRKPFAEAFATLAGGNEGWVAGRVVLQQRGRYTVVTDEGEISSELEARMRRTAASAAELPCVGDWVVIRDVVAGGVAILCAMLPRLTKFSRRAAGPENSEQVLAANVDTIFIAMGLDGDFNLRRLERYLTVAWASGARPVVLLTKADLCTPDQLAHRKAEVREIAPQVSIVVTSVLSDVGIGAVDPFLGRGETIALLGSSGVGKSTLVNALLQQQLLRTKEVRSSDSRGRHTTTQRQLFRVRGGALIIDTPGIRELQLWDASAGFEASFADVDLVAANCRFRDCRHHDQPGCAVVQAVDRGDLPSARVASYLKLKGEGAAFAARLDPGLAHKRKRAAISSAKLLRQKYRQS